MKDGPDAHSCIKKASLSREVEEFLKKLKGLASLGSHFYRMWNKAK